MKKIFKYVLLVSIAGYIFINIIIYSFAYLYSHGAGGEGKIKEYEFKMTMEDFQKNIRLLCSELKCYSYKEKVDNVGYKMTLTTIQIVENSKKIIYYLESQDLSDGNDKKTTVYLIYINGKKNDDFGLFSLERYKNVKLFEKVIIEPLSKKYKRSVVKN